MLIENRNVRQEPGLRRRWFEDDGLELVVWEDAAGAVEGFQLCRLEHALTWRRDAGFTHARIDEGDTNPWKNLTPVLVPNGVVPWAEFTEKFRAGSATLEKNLRELVLARLATRA